MENIKPIIKAINKTNLIQLISDEIKLNGNDCNLNFIDTSEITDMAFLFSNSKFNGDISNWNTSNVTIMNGMFFHSQFNNDISKWDTSSVKNMGYMFANSIFNKDITNWNIQKIDSIINIFYKSKSTNIPYWAKIINNDERLKAYQAYHVQKEKNILNNEFDNYPIIKNNFNFFKI